MKNQTAVLVAALFWTCSLPAQTILFSDDFDTDTSANWSVFNGSDTGTSDFTVDFAFDYSTTKYTSNGMVFFIPPAPNSMSGSTKGVKLTVNKNDGVAERSAVNLYPKNQNFTNNYALRFDMWIDYNGPAFGGTGSTEFAIFGLNHLGTQVNWAPAAASVPLPSSDGVWYAVTGEGGAAGDYRNYEGDPAGNPLRFTGPEGGFLDRDGNGTTEDESVGSTGQDYPLNLIFPSPPYETKGVPGKRWVEVELRQRDGVISWVINGFVIAEKQIASSFASGTIMLGTMDIFTSIADPKADNYVIFDNVRVVNLATEPALLRLTVEATDATAAEPSDGATIVVTRSGPTTAPLTVNYRLLGTATAGSDYSIASTNLVTIPAGASSATVTITTIDDAKAEPEETIELALLAGTGYEVFAPMLAKAVLADDGDVTPVSVSTLVSTAYEKVPDDLAVFVVERSGDSSADLAVNIELTGTASAADFQPVELTIIIPAGSLRATVKIMPVADAAAEADETVLLTLKPGADYAVTTNSTATITIKDAGELKFSDTFDSDSSRDLLLRFGASNGIEDFSALFAYDYSADTIEASPHATEGTTKGLKLTVNKADPTASGTAGLNLYPINQNFSGNYVLKFDMFLNFSSAVGGTTEHAVFGVNHSGNLTNRHANAGSDGVWFAVETDGSGSGGGRSYVVYSPTNTTSVPPFAAKPASQFREQFPTPPFLAAGAPSGSWVDVMVRQEGNLITWLMNGNLIFQHTNIGPFTSGNVMLGYMDTFASIGSTNNFVVYDNVRVFSLGGATGPTEIRIATIQQSGAQLKIAFAAANAQASNFVVESTAALPASFAPEPAVIRQTSPGQFEATVTPSGPTRFYRLRLP